MSAPFLAQLDRIPKYAACDAGVLVLGETGTGKELVAQAVHYLSPRAGHPWVAINCGALTEALYNARWSAPRIATIRWYSAPSPFIFSAFASNGAESINFRSIYYRNPADQARHDATS